MGGKEEIAVYGWYGHGNHGDEAFRECFKHLWPSLTFTFTDSLSDVNKYDALWIGGGSFLDQPIPSIETVSIPICFIGVGCGNVHPNNMDALRRAKAIVLRDSASAASLPNGCVPILASDLLFSLPSQTAPENREKTLIFPNCFVLPVAGQDARYGVAYEWFRLEFNDICRSLVAAGHELHVIPMYVFDGIDDRTATALTLDASIPVIRHEKMHLNEVKEMVASARLAITQRLHGAIFAFLADTPCVCIAHHDKIWSFCSETGSPVMDYYGFSQRAFKSTMCLANEKNPKRLQYIEKARNQWAEISGIVERLSFS